MSGCGALASTTLLDYWAADLPEGETNRVEEHLFACRECATELAELAALAAGLTGLARQGRISGVISRGVLNRLQREGAHVRLFSLRPGETIPCAVFPGDDLVVSSLRADFSSVDAVTLTVRGPQGEPLGGCEAVPAPERFGELLWATPAAIIQQMPSMRLELTLTSASPSPVELGTYVLEHTAAPRA